MTPHQFILTLALTASFTLQAQDITAPLSWTASDGRVIQAKFIKLDGEAVVIQRGTQEFTVPFAKLAPESVAQAKRAALASRPARTPIAPAATAKADEPQVLPRAELIADGWLADGDKGGSSPLLPLQCDDLGDLVLPVGTLTAHGSQRGLVKLSGYDGSLKWSVAPKDLADGVWQNPEVQRDAAGDFIIAVVSEGADKAHDIAVAKLDHISGTVLWRWRYDGAQHGDDALGGLTADAAGNVILAINVGGMPVPGERYYRPAPPAESLDSAVIKLDGKTGQVLWEAKDHAIPGARDTGRLSEAQPKELVLLRHDQEAPAGKKKQAFLLALDPATGKVRWQVESGGPAYRDLWQLVEGGILHTNETTWSLTGLDGKNVWSVPVIFNGREGVMAPGAASMWIEWLRQDISKDDVKYTSMAGLMQLKDGAVTVRKEPLAGPADLANPAPQGQLEAAWRAGICDKAGDLLFISYGPSDTGKYDFKPRLQKVAAKDGAVLWTKDINTIAAKNPGYKPLLRLDAEGNVLYLWQENTRLENTVTVAGMKFGGQSVISLAKISPANGEMIWHQRVVAHLGGTVSASNWQTDSAGNVFVVFSSPGSFSAGVTGSADACMNTLKFNGATGAVEWLSAFPKTKATIEFAAGASMKATAKETAAAIQLTSVKLSSEPIFTIPRVFKTSLQKLGLKPEDFVIEVSKAGSKDVTLKLESLTLTAFLDKLAEATGNTLEWSDKGVSLVGKGKQ